MYPQSFLAKLKKKKKKKKKKKNMKFSFFAFEKKSIYIAWPSFRYVDSYAARHACTDFSQIQQNGET